jgi:hypothetical protein
MIILFFFLNSVRRSYCVEKKKNEDAYVLTSFYLLFFPPIEEGKLTRFRRIFFFFFLFDWRRTNFYLHCFFFAFASRGGLILRVIICRKKKISLAPTLGKKNENFVNISYLIRDSFTFPRPPGPKQHIERKLRRNKSLFQLNANSDGIKVFFNRTNPGRANVDSIFFLFIWDPSFFFSKRNRVKITSCE